MSQTSQNIIVARINKTRRQIRIVELATALTTLGACLLTALFVAVTLDHWAFSDGLPDALRYLFFTVGVGAAIVYLAARLIPMFRYSINPAYAADVLEQSHRGMKNRLLNWVFLSREKQDASNPSFQTKRLVLDRIERETVARLDAVPDQLVVDCTSAIRWGIAFAAVLALFCGYTIFSPKSALQSFARAAAPFLDIEPPQSLNFQTVEPGDVTLYRGEFLDVSTSVDRPANAVYFVYSTLDGRIVDRRTPMDAEYGFRFKLRFPAEKQGLKESIKYRVESGNSRSKTYAVVVQPEISIDVKSTEYRYPAYAKLKPRTVENVGDLRAIEGTETTIIAKSNIKMNRAVLLLDNDSRREIRLTISPDKTEAVGKLTLSFDKEQPEKQICTSYTLRCWDEKNRTNPSPSIYRVEVLRAEESDAADKEKQEEEKREQTQNPNEDKNSAKDGGENERQNQNGDGNENGEQNNGGNGERQNKDAQSDGQAENDAGRRQGNENRPDASAAAETNEAANQTQSGNITNGRPSDSQSGAENTLNSGGGQQDNGDAASGVSGSKSGQNQNSASNDQKNSAGKQSSGKEQSSANGENVQQNPSIDGETNPGDVFEEALNMMKRQNAENTADQSTENQDASNPSANLPDSQGEPRNSQNDESQNDAAQSESTNRQQNGRHGRQEKTTQTGAAEAAIDPATEKPLTSDHKPDEIPTLHDDAHATDQTGFYVAREGNDPNVERVNFTENDRVFEDPNDSGAGSAKANEKEKARPLDGKTTSKQSNNNGSENSDATPSERDKTNQNANTENPKPFRNDWKPSKNNDANNTEQTRQNQSSDENASSNPSGDSGRAGNSDAAQNPQNEDDKNLTRNRITPLQEYGHYHEREEKRQESADVVPQTKGSSFFDRQAESANLEYAKRQTSLAIKYLEEELAKERPNPQLLERLGWTKDDLQRFVNRWKAMRQNAEESPGSNEERQWNETLRNIGLSPKSTVGDYRIRTPQSHTAITESQRYAPPKGKYEELMRAYTEGISGSENQ
ncbi:MAG: hypothetical protein LBT05_14360 [Planctomycetaceae bacterium]|jgi:hypothetical protein|nr:hypothetical protein [Planctomycetaceae bacterium]